MISVIIPMYNESAIIRWTVTTLVESLEQSGDAWDYELVFSDDGSTDGCGDLVLRAAEEISHPHGTIRVIRHEPNAGKGAAVREGMLAAEGDLLFFTDSDLAYGCDILAEMAHSLREEDDILIGSRAIHPDGYAGYPFLRKLASKTFLKLLALTAGFSHSDSQCGIKLFRQKTAKQLFPLCEVNGWAFDFEVLLLAERFGCRIAEFPACVRNHRASKIHLFRDTLRMLKDIRAIKKRIRKTYGTADRTHA